MRLRNVVIFAALITYAVCQGDDAVTATCNSQTRCSDCILANPQCRWCAAPDFAGTSRCYPDTDEISINLCGGMNSNDSQNPQGGILGMSQDELVGLNQIQPRTVNVAVRPGMPVMFPLSVRPANNFPVDLYLLMDLSFSMRDDLANLKRLGADIAREIGIISTDFTIGFGSFVDKRLAPFVNINPDRLIDPCDDDCDSPYSYRHVISLTDNTTVFNNSIQAARISGNQDSPEGGFDGFLQVLVCRNLIGWRDISRKLILYITDAGFHFAGDGKLGGVVKPHDGLCKIPDVATTPGQTIDYNDWDVLDYPSIGQISEALRDLDAIPIFAAEGRVKPLYDRLAEELGDRAFTGTLAADSGNVVGLVADLYNQISQRIIFESPNIPGVTFNPVPANCPGEVVDGVCTGVTIGMQADFDIGITLDECTPELAAGPITIPVSIVGFGSFDVVLEAICGCPCEETEDTDSASCNGNGTFSCGICTCNSGRFGEQCQCDETGQEDGMLTTCPVNSGLMCTGRGTCTCGICDCNTNPVTGQQLFFGPACECANTICRRTEGDPLCSNQGACTCDGCDCRTEPTTGMNYFGTYCECTPNTNCRDPTDSTEEICNGHGTCTCEGTCLCDVDSPYFGTYCELCSGDPICADVTCDENEPCAQCGLNLVTTFNDEISTGVFFSEETFDSLLSSGGLPNGTRRVFDDQDMESIELPPGYCGSLCPMIVLINGTQDAEYDIQGIESVRCETSINDCMYRFYVAISEQDQTVLPIHLEVEGACTVTVRISESSDGVPAYAVVLGIILPLLVLGLLALILLKVLLIILDRVEVRRFERDLANSKYNKQENPLFQKASKEYKNPTYGQ